MQKKVRRSYWRAQAAAVCAGLSCHGATMKRSHIIGEILAAWEDTANTAAIDCHRNAEEDNYRLLWDGIELPKDATDQQYADAISKAHEAIANGRELADAWRFIAKALRRYLRVLQVDTYAQRRAKEENAPAKPWQLRREHNAAMQAANVVPHVVERAPVKLDRDKLETEAQKHGLWKGDK